ncbi:endonuclease/exonuclease/phosphatase family protein [Staphylococcus equorum]|uniref:endonuclease/exonuclease/phosphatase family protein n=1 Tax=Staphylococcus equorum TaxID=246432 RepID=UPI00101DC273|nr:endonuclease/exonuclease/phosphatase family protein [Staphylococcus equorum]RYD11408.1 endonuclease [Staphylococcus equorum]
MNKMPINIGCWNINQRAGASKNLLPNLIFEELMKRKLDIIVLTEFYESDNYQELILNLINEHYIVRTSKNDINSNQILIAVKNELISSELHVHHFDNDNSLPNLLHLEINDMHIIGTRIKVGRYSKNQNKVNQDFIDRRNQLMKLIDFTSNLEGRTLILGDFNNGKHSEYDVDKTYKGVAREYFNYYLMKEDFESNNFLVHTPTESYSWKGNSNNQCKLDHIITKNILEISNLKYDWKFINNLDYKEKVGYPDHAILTATISIDDKEG